MRLTLLSSCVLAAVMALSASPSAQAADFSINPTRINLDSTKAVDTLTLVSNEDREVSFQVSLLKWTQDEKGEWVETPSSDLVVYPALMKMPAKGRGLVRVGAKSKAPLATEGTYRLILQELPGAPVSDGTAVRLLTRVSLPVFLAPTTPTVNLTLQAEKFSKGARLTVLNAGNVHLSPQSTQVEFLDAEGNVVGEPVVAAPGPAYVLGGARNSWTQDWGKTSCQQAVSVKISFENSKEVLTAPFTGGCQ